MPIMQFSGTEQEVERLQIDSKSSCYQLEAQQLKLTDELVCNL